MAFWSVGAWPLNRDMVLLGSILLLPIIYAAPIVLISHANAGDLLHVSGIFPLTTMLATGFIFFAQRAAFARYQLPVPAEREGALIVAALVVVITIAGFGIFKQAILPVRGFVLDPLFARMGRMLLGGTAPWEVTHAMFGSLWPTVMLDRLYSFWILPVGTLPMLAVVLAPTKRRRTQLLLAWMLAWMLIGTVGAWLLGSAGPCFYTTLVGPDDNFAQLGRHLAALSAQAAAAGTSIDALHYQTLLLQAHGTREFVAAGGISAMPSMHVAFATCLVLAVRVLVPLLYRPTIAYLGLIWIGSIHFGWHYAVDGPVAVLAMLAVWRLSGWLARLAYPQGDGGALPRPAALALDATPSAPLRSGDD